MSLGMRLLCSYLLTLLTELPCGLLWKLRTKKDFLLLVCINTLTNPTVVLLSYTLKIRTPAVYSGAEFLLLELLVFVAEALLYKYWMETIRRPWLYSLQVNALSVLMGILFSAIVL